MPSSPSPGGDRPGVRRARTYAKLYDNLRPRGSREESMRAVVDALWDALAATGVSWIGFYTTRPDSDVMILGPARDKPACSPIKLHGVCGRALRDRCPIIVADVRSLGENYIACDPADMAEIVVPLFESDGACYGVLDADSHEVGAFDDSDVTGITGLVEHMGLSVRPSPGPAILRL